jgi:hypothetical protein
VAFQFQLTPGEHLRVPQVGHTIVFIDELGRPCLKDSQGTIMYLVVSVVPPIAGANIIPPIYEPAPQVVAPEARTTLWDHVGGEDLAAGTPSPAAKSGSIRSTRPVAGGLRQDRR